MRHRTLSLIGKWMLVEHTSIDRFEHRKKCANHVMQDEDVRQVDTTGKWLQFVYCLPSFRCVILFSLSQNPAKIMKMRNISKPWPNLSSSEGSQGTSACQISGHYCHAFPIKYGNHTFEMFHWVKMPPKLVKSTDRDQTLIRWSGYSSIQYFKPFPMRSPENTRKHLISPVSRSFFGLCDLEICHMTLKIWEPQTVGVSNHMIKYQSNRCRNVAAKAGTDGQTDRRTDRQGRLWICLPQLKMTCTTHHNTEQVTKT